MTDIERKAIYEYLREQRRHLLGQAKACELLMQTLLPNEQKVVYNTGNGGKGNQNCSTTTTPVLEFREQ